jgi:hypothetical protein
MLSYSTPVQSYPGRCALDASSSAHPRSLRPALATLDSDTSDNPRFDDHATEDLSHLNFGTDRVWRDEDGVWWTNFPPPADFYGEERGHWSDEDYERECSEDECDLLDAARDVQLADQRTEEEAERSMFFAELRAELTGLPGCHAGLDPGPAFPSTAIK